MKIWPSAFNETVLFQMLDLLCAQRLTLLYTIQKNNIVQWELWQFRQFPSVAQIKHTSRNGYLYRACLKLVLG